MQGVLGGVFNSPDVCWAAVLAQDAIRRCDSYDGVCKYVALRTVPMDSGMEAVFAALGRDLDALADALGIAPDGAKGEL
jgi:hypothetical protein